MDHETTVANAMSVCSQPLIGLRHIHCYQMESDSSGSTGNGSAVVYWCGLCESSCSDNIDSVISHVSDQLHRTNYMKLNYLNYYDHLQREPNNTSLLLEYSRMIEADEGRQNIRFSDGPVPTIVLRAHQMLHPVSQPSSASPIFLGTASISETLYKIAVKSNVGSVGNLLQPMVPYLVTTEEEAAKALEVANRLTRCLLEYRLGSSPGK